MLKLDNVFSIVRSLEVFNGSFIWGYFSDHEYDTVMITLLTKKLSRRPVLVKPEVTVLYTSTTRSTNGKEGISVGVIESRRGEDVV